MEQKNKGNLIAIIVTSIICIAGIVLDILMIPKAKSFDIATYFGIIIYLITIYYVIEGYKKPHGNLLKYLLWGFGFALICRAIAYATYSPASAYLFGLGAVGVCYMSGKLNKMRRNMILGSFVFLLILSGYIVSVCIVSVEERLYVAGYCASLIQWAVIMGTYLLRFHSHREAGINQDLLK